MKKKLPHTTIKMYILMVMTLFICSGAFAQNSIPFEIKNTSDYGDGELFVAIVGISNDRHVWIDMKTGQQKDMSPSYNTVQGPMYNGNKGPGTNGMYANCFTKLSDIPSKKINLQGIYGCRMFISVKSQLYFYFFGATGAQTGYTSPSHTDPTDPNKGIKYEVIELTYNTLGFWGNTTRVDGYQYPMGMEVTSNNGSVTKTGELKSHAEIGAAFLSSVPTEFKSCYDAASGSILFPTKTVDWADGSIGTMPNRGPYVNYMQSYIDQVWAKYRNEDLIFSSGDAGVFKGRVSGNQLTMTCISGGFNGRTGIVQNKPTTQEAFEGKGVFDRGIADVTVDLVVQAQLTAAFTRHLISLAANPGQQDWSKPATYYAAGPCNYYAKFWHRTDISLNGLSYGFAYDDVFNQSSTMYSGSPKSILVLFGGYAKSVPPTDPQVPSSTGLVTVYKDCNYTGFSGGLSIGDYNLAKLKELGIKDDDISSLLVTQGYQAILYQDDNFGGTSTVINSDNTCLNTIWNDKVTSLRIIANGATNVAGTYFLQNRNSGLNMDVFGISTADGANISQGTPNGGTNQQFKFTHLGEGVYQVLAVHSGKSVDIDAIKTNDGANVQQWTYFGSANQQFIVFPTDIAGCYKLIAKHSGKVVEVGGASLANNANIQQWTNNNQTCGQWKFISLSTPPQVGTGTGLTGNYFNGMIFETPVYNRTDATISFDWGNGSPNAAVNVDGFSARWTGQVQPKYTGEYTFYMNSDNGRRLWVNGQLVIDKWIDDWNIDYSGKINLVAGVKYDIKIEYFENYGGAGCKLEWSSVAQTREVVPASQLYPNPLPTVTITSPANNASFNAPASFTITASATDNGGSISKVEFYNGGNKLGEDNSAPYEFNWTNVATGTYILTTRAFDNLSAVGVSGSVTVKVTTGTNPPPVNQAPSVTLTAPANGTSLNAPASIAITANASDADGSVAKVEFYNGTAKIGEDLTAPYAYTVSNAGAGTYVISVKAIDNLGAVTTSGSVSVTVVAASTDQCASVAQYAENNGYVAGSKVKNAGKRYECKEFPYSGWCNGASWAYAPGTGAYWSDAWYEKGSCAARTGEADALAIESSVLISPNPSSGIINIHVETISIVTLYNAQGMEVMKSTVTPQGAMDISQLSSGMYTVRIDTGAEVLTRMVIKN
ncbi:MAG: RICIN domain-containing protein [Cytophagaceae bacterium]|nr:RICIN domain-containing protein [Cytophagaceae bacterium]